MKAFALFCCMASTAQGTQTFGQDTELPSDLTEDVQVSSGATLTIPDGVSVSVEDITPSVNAVKLGSTFSTGFLVSEGTISIVKTSGTATAVKVSNGAAQILGGSVIARSGDSNAGIAIELRQDTIQAAPPKASITAGTVEATNTAVEVRGGEVTIDDGSFEVTGALGHGVRILDSGSTALGKATINGGIFTAARPLLFNGPQSTVTITGGQFTATEDGTSNCLSLSNDASTEITGGSFTGGRNLLLQIEPS